MTDVMIIQKRFKTLNYIHDSTQRRTNNSFLAPRNTHSLTESLDKIFQVTFFNLLSPNSDQDQFSPNNIHTLSRDKL